MSGAADMAESKRESLPSHKTQEEMDEDAQKRRDTITIVMFVVGAIVIVAGMFLLSKFLSGQ